MLRKEYTQLQAKLETLQKRLGQLEEESRKLREKNFYDAETGVYQSWYLKQRVDDELKRAMRYRQFISFIILNLADKDRYPPESTIKKVEQIARIIKGSLQRATDMVSFLNRDQIMAVLPETDRQGAWTVINRYKATFADKFGRILYALQTFPTDITSTEFVWERLNECSDKLYKGIESLPGR